MAAANSNAVSKKRLDAGPGAVTEKDPWTAELEEENSTRNRSVDVSVHALLG